MLVALKDLTIEDPPWKKFGENVVKHDNNNNKPYPWEPDVVGGYKYTGDTLMQGYYKSEASDRARLGGLAAGKATQELQELVKLDSKHTWKNSEYSCDDCFVKIDLNKSEFHTCILTRWPADATRATGKAGPKQLSNKYNHDIYTCKCYDEFSSSAVLKSHIIASADEAHGSIPCFWKDCTHWFATPQDRDEHLKGFHLPLDPS